uniref:G-protein coupled receptors family 1 profile domain-containing protein n=1 Tax=Anopheles atroparvus TaxID=41427 RepID=A0A182J8T4_ANOAO
MARFYQTATFGKLFHKWIEGPAGGQRRQRSVHTAEVSVGAPSVRNNSKRHCRRRYSAVRSGITRTSLGRSSWTDPTNLVSLAVLAFINVLVIVGNCLVIAAVLCSHKLRSVTNFFIVSLAVADLLVGLAVLPFSATWEVFKVG